MSKTSMKMPSINQNDYYQSVDSFSVLKKSPASTPKNTLTCSSKNFRSIDNRLTSNVPYSPKIGSKQVKLNPSKNIQKQINSAEK